MELLLVGSCCFSSWSFYISFSFFVFRVVHVFVRARGAVYCQLVDRGLCCNELEGSGVDMQRPSLMSTYWIRRGRHQAWCWEALGSYFLGTIKQSENQIPLPFK